MSYSLDFDQGRGEKISAFMEKVCLPQFRYPSLKVFLHSSFLGSAWCHPLDLSHISGEVLGSISFKFTFGHAVVHELPQCSIYDTIFRRPLSVFQNKMRLPAYWAGLVEESVFYLFANRRACLFAAGCDSGVILNSSHLYCNGI